MKRSTPIRRTPLKRVSDSRRAEMKEYAAKRAVFLAKFFLCQVELKERGFDWTVPPQDKGDRILVAHIVSRSAGHVVWVDVSPTSFTRSRDVHHMDGRGKNYLNEATWLAVSRANHNRIGNQPSWARARGYLV
jgi:hypothetical protein